jgi:hypothetical protein
MYIPCNWEFGSALSKLQNFGGGVWTPQTPPPSVCHWKRDNARSRMEASSARKHGCRDKGRWMKYWARLGCWISPCYGPFLLGTRFESYEPCTSLIFVRLFRAAINRRFWISRYGGTTVLFFSVTSFWSSDWLWISGDKSLVQSLVFDALVTDGLERPMSPTPKEDEKWVGDVHGTGYCLPVATTHLHTHLFPGTSVSWSHSCPILCMSLHY